MLIPSRPLFFISLAILFNLYPLVVITVFLIPEFFLISLIISIKSFLIVGSPPVSLILDTPSSERAFASLLISSLLINFLLSLLSILYPSGKQ